MRRRVQRSMILVIAVTLLISYVLMTVVVYSQTLTLLKEQAQQESDYIRKAIGISGTQYLDELDAVQRNTRVTWIDANGAVLYDTNEQTVTLKNHKSRKEVQDALAKGSGQDVRVSDTLGKEMYYYAVRLDNGTVLRVSKNMDSMMWTAIHVLPYMAVIAIIMLIAAWLLARWQVTRLIEPINHLDLEHPLNNEVYDELRPLLQSMEAQKQEKAKVEQMRREFSANVSHELKTPLTSISGYAELIKSGMVRQEDVEGFAERIYIEARRMIQLVEDIIKLSKLDEGTIELEKEDVELYELTREIISSLSLKAEQQQIRLELSGEPVVYHGIRQVLYEMIFNLCENGIKYNHEGGSVSVWSGNTLEGPRVIVADTGIGIPKEHQDRIFERFYRVDKSHSKETGGTGLGLSIVKHGAMLHGAQIKLESTEREGTRVEILFPKTAPSTFVK